MKISSKGEFQQIAINHLSSIDLTDLMNLYKKCTVKPYFLLVNVATLASGNLLRFRSNYLKGMQK